MRICRYEAKNSTSAAFYFDTHISPIAAAADAYADATHERVSLPKGDNLLELLPGGAAHAAAAKIAQWIDRVGAELPAAAKIPVADVQLLVPIPRPNKLFLLAGNYAKHIEEGGGVAAERSQTFPYVFMKPPTTTLTHPGSPVIIPAVSPDAVDWEVELAAVIGKLAKGVKEADALSYVAGYTVVNDISNRRFRPNPGRKERANDKFFDWLHGKWHDSFCACGPCIASPAAVPDPQALDIKLSLNGEMRQDATTAQQIFPIAAVIEFISSFVTLEPGDIISTGTPAGVGSTTKTFLKPGDTLEASIGSIGVLRSPVVAETA